MFATCPDGGIGRHEGLKIPWPLRPCGFDPRLGYRTAIFRNEIAVLIVSINQHFTHYNLFPFISLFCKIISIRWTICWTKIWNCPKNILSLYRILIKTYNFMAATELNLSKKAREDNKHEVLIRISSGRGIRFRIKSNVFVSPEFWSNETQSIVVPPKRKTNTDKVQMAQQEKATLDEYLRNLSAIINAAQDAKEELTKDWIEECFRLAPILNDPANRFRPDSLGSLFTSSNLRKALQIEQDAIEAAAKHQEQEEQAENKPMRIADAIPLFCERKSISANRRKTYGTLKGQLERFELYTQLTSNKDFVLDTEQISGEVVELFRIYLKGEKKLQEQNPHIFAKILSRYPITIRSKKSSGAEDKESKPRTRALEERGENTVIGQLKRLAAVCHWLQKMGQIDSDVFQNVEVGAEQYATPFYLSKEELDVIANYDMSKQSKTLQVQRDIMLFHASIGARVSDLYALTKANVIDGFIRYVPAKTESETGVTARIPLSQRAKELIEKYDCIDGQGRLFPFVCQQAYNEAIREILTLCGICRRIVWRDPASGKSVTRPINEVATSHTMRKSFIGQAYKVVRDPNLVGAMSGHAENSRAFSRYREIQDDDLQSVIDAMEQR